jgi:hypothetical protein
VSARGSLVLWALVLGLVAGPASAEKKTRVTVFLLPAPGFTPQVVARVTAALNRALAANPRLDVKDSDKLLVEYAGEIPNEAITEANTALAEGIEMLGRKQASEALARLEKAVSVYEEVLPYIKKETLARAMMALAVAQADSRQPRKALVTFTQLLVWRPRITYDTGSFNPAHLALFEKVRTATQKLKKGSIELVTTPSGARAYIDGRYVGVTPTIAFGFTVGQHYATYKRTEYIKASQRVQVSPTTQNTYTLALKRSEKFLLLKQSIDSARKVLGQASATSDMVSLSTFLYIDQAVFASMGYVAPGKVSLQAYLYDLRSKLRLNTASATVNTRNLAAEIAPVARTLYFNVRYDGSLEAPPEPPPPPPPKRSRFYATWWFWTAIGVSVAAIVLPVVLTRRSPACPVENAYCVGYSN